MNDVIMYFLKVNIAIALFYMFYRLVFYNDTFWAARRFYLVFAIVLSAVHPLISLSGWLEKQQPMQTIVTNYLQLPEVTVSATPASNFTLEHVLLAVYGFVSFVLVLKMCVQLLSILRWKMKGKKQILYGTEIVAIDTTITPFSFFNSIFINPALHTEQETLQILTHEKTHALQRHSLDVLLSEMLTIVCWINPAAWLLKREIRHNLEFLADNKVLQSGFNSKDYQYHLLQLSYQTPEINLVNKFNISPLKKRITMMNQQKSAKAGIMKYTLIIPLALALILSSNAQTVVNKAKTALKSTKETQSAEKTVQPSTKKYVKTTVKFTAPVIKKEQPEGEIIYQKVDKTPEYPGGIDELMSYIGRNLKYPVEAQKNKIQGKVFVRFIVNASGKVVNAVVIKSIQENEKKLDEVVVVGYGAKNETEEKLNQNRAEANNMKLLEQEALRVVNAMPDWIPGEQGGKKVSVYFTLPINFKMRGDSKNTDIKDEGKLNIRSINGEKPMYMIDGKIATEDEFKAVKPELIKEVSVLKDKSATSLYGEQGKNGVVIITSKK